MKYISWNVNSVRARLPLVKKMIESENPDVLMLQELKCVDDDFPFDDFDNYNCFIWGQKSYNGVAILTKKNISVLDTHKIPLGDRDDHARCIKVVLQDVSVICVYVPCGDVVGPVYEFKKRFLSDIRDLLKNSKDERLLIGGDFNVALTDEDVEYPKDFADGVLCLPEFRDLMRSIVAANMYDVIAPKQYTWWDYRSPNKGLRIDYILTRGMKGTQEVRKEYRRMSIKNYEMSSNIIRKKPVKVQTSAKVKIIDVKPSDHVPVVFQEIA